MAALLAERPRSGSGSRTAPSERRPAPDDTDSGWLRRLRDRRTEAAADRPSRRRRTATRSGWTRTRFPRSPRSARLGPGDAPLSSAALGGDTIDAGTVAPSAGAYAGPRAAGAADPELDSDDPTAVRRARGPAARRTYDDGYDDLPPEDEEDGARRHRLVVIGLPLLALARRRRPGLVDRERPAVGVRRRRRPGGLHAVGERAPRTARPRTTPAGAAAHDRGAEVFDPQGDGDPDNPDDVPLAFDGDPATAWSTYEYRGSPAFGNLKDGLGLLLTSAPRRSWPASR